jgi:hypothetical protein
MLLASRQDFEFGEDIHQNLVVPQSGTGGRPKDEYECIAIACRQWISTQGIAGDVRRAINLESVGHVVAPGRNRDRLFLGIGNQNSGLQVARTRRWQELDRRRTVRRSAAKQGHKGQ